LRLAAFLLGAALRLAAFLLGAALRFPALRFGAALLRVTAPRLAAAFLLRDAFLYPAFFDILQNF